MAYEQKPNSGSIFANDRKEKDTHPDGTGSALIECPCCHAVTDFFVDSWVKKPEGKKPFRSLAFKAKNKQAARGGRPATTDDIP